MIFINLLRFPINYNDNLLTIIGFPIGQLGFHVNFLGHQITQMEIVVIV